MTRNIFPGEREPNSPNLRARPLAKMSLPTQAELLASFARRSAIPQEYSNEMRSQQLAAVTYNEIGEKAFTASRMIIKPHYNLETPPPKADPQTDGPVIRLRFAAEQHENQYSRDTPRLLGFALLASERTIQGDYEYTYSHTPEDDPYINALAIADHATDPLAVMDLARSYNEAGATFVGNKLERYEHTIGSLQKALLEGGLYNAPEPGASAEELRIQYYHGRLVGQCLNFAASFIRDVTAVAPCHTAHVISGHVLAAKMSQTQHAQAMVTSVESGMVGIFDPTPNYTLQSQRSLFNMPFTAGPIGFSAD